MDADNIQKMVHIQLQENNLEKLLRSKLNKV